MLLNSGRGEEELNVPAFQSLNRASRAIRRKEKDETFARKASDAWLAVLEAEQALSSANSKNAVEER